MKYDNRDKVNRLLQGIDVCTNDLNELMKAKSNIDRNELRIDVRDRCTGEFKTSIHITDQRRDILLDEHIDDLQKRIDDMKKELEDL